MNNKDKRLGIGKYPLPTNSIIGKGLPIRDISSDRDITYSIHNRLCYTIRHSPIDISNSEMVYIISNSNDIINDNTTYDNLYGKGTTLGSAISSAMIANGGNNAFRRHYHYCSDMLTIIDCYSNNDNSTYTTIDRDIYYMSLYVKHISISNMLNSISVWYGDYITIPAHNISIPTNIISSDSTLHKYSAIHYLGKISFYDSIGSEPTYYALPTISSDDDDTTCSIVSSDSDTTIAPTRPVNNIKRGSSAIALYRDSRTSRLNDKSLKDILPVNSDITTSMSDSISTLCAMRIDSGIAPSIVWTGNSRDYMIIQINDYDTTNYYAMYSSEVYSDIDMYNMIYNHYNGIYDTYAKYAMDTKIRKYHKVFNDDDYISYAFNLKKGIVGKAPILPKVGFVHNTYQYDSEYYYYKVYNGMFYDNMHFIPIGSCDIIPSSSKDIDFIGSYDSGFNPTKYFESIIDSIGSTDDYSTAISIANRCKNYINSIITTMIVNDISTYYIDTLLNAVDSVYYYCNKKYISYDDYTLYTFDDNAFNPKTLNMHKGYKGIDSNGITKPTYISGRLSRISSSLYQNSLYDSDITTTYNMHKHMFTYLGNIIIDSDSICNAINGTSYRMFTNTTYLGINIYNKYGIDGSSFKRWYYTTFNTTTFDNNYSSNGIVGKHSKDSADSTYSTKFKRSAIPTNRTYAYILKRINLLKGIYWYYNVLKSHSINSNDDEYIDRICLSYNINWYSLYSNIMMWHKYIHRW